MTEQSCLVEMRCAACVDVPIRPAGVELSLRALMSQSNPPFVCFSFFCCLIMVSQEYNFIFFFYYINRNALEECCSFKKTVKRGDSTTCASTGNSGFTGE